MTLASTLTGCGFEDAAREPAQARAEALLGDRVPAGVSTYQDVLPEDVQTRITAREEVVEEDGVPTAIVDATGDRVFFPLEREARSFASRAELVELVVRTFGARELFRDPETGELEGVRGSYVQHGRAYFEDDRSGLRYRITDPVMAFVGGVDGWVVIGSDAVCLDPDGECESSRASYLELDAFPTASTHWTIWGGTGWDPDIGTQLHTFFNKTWFPFFWARHGSNVTLLNYGPLPATWMRTTGLIWWWNGGWQSNWMPYMDQHNVDFLETAVWCLGSDQCAEYQAVAACGAGRIDDPDISGGRRTGNGPENNTWCPSGGWDG